MKKTAVEWLEDRFLIGNGRLTFTEINQAKEMEKEQIIDAHNNGRNILPPNENGKQYYNVIFKNK